MRKIEVSEENFIKQLAITNDIDRKIALVREDTGLYSTHKHMLEHESFLSLVTMGDSIVNYIFHLMFEHGTCWLHVYLLSKIIKDGPMIPKEISGKIKHISLLWMNWYLESEYYKNNDIYYNLV